jgi:hypothetical protein
MNLCLIPCGAITEITRIRLDGRWPFIPDDQCRIYFTFKTFQEYMLTYHPNQVMCSEDSEYIMEEIGRVESFRPKVLRQREIIFH